MKKIVFIIGDTQYSKELLARCLERYSNSTCYHFFNQEEMFLYLDLSPSMIISAGDEFSLDSVKVAAMRNKMETLPSVFLVNEKSISIHSIKNNGLKRKRNMGYMNLYSSLTALVSNHEYSRVASLMMY